VFPILEEKHFHFSGTGIGHPLIPAGQRIVSDFSLVGEGRIALVTGSNMAGKSTFLRSLGVNIVLAQIGSVVCAQQMQLSLVKLMSSMRIADNLAENTSTFYAELKRSKALSKQSVAKSLCLYYWMRSSGALIHLTAIPGLKH
jgi:DNA mismatch repair ATPase MutS